MNCFQLVKTVLDELYERIPSDSEQAKDDSIREKLISLTKEYKGLARGVSIDYRDITTRFAYIYKYVTSHANVVHQLIRTSSDLATLFEQKKVNVACIGGGPGSDFLGVLKYIMQAGQTPFLRCTLFDREQAWADCWDDVDDKLESAQFRISTFFRQFDVTDASTWSNNIKYLQSDLFTMIYFMSEIDSLRDESEAFFSDLFEKAKSGALFLYVDNNSAQFYNWFDSLAANHSLSVLQSDSMVMPMDYSEQKKDLAVYWEKFGDPKLKANIAFRICRKK